MKAMKGAVNLANWIIRVALVLVLILSFYKSAQAVFQGNTSLDNLLGLITVVVAIFLLIGGFMKSYTMTIVSGLILAVIFVLLIFRDWVGLNEIFALHLLMAGTALYFAAAGNGR